MSRDADESEPICILAVDDDTDFVELVALSLEREQHRFEAITATSGEEELLQLSSTTIDCIVSDYDMPGMNGLDFLEKARSKYDALPFILFTGRGSEAIASDAICAGVTEYLNKASHSDQFTVLANRISNVVGQYRAERELQETTERTRKLYTGITDAIFTLDTTDHFTDVNKQAEVLLERTESELVGKNIQNEFPAAANTKFDAEIRRAMVENVVVEFEEYYPPFEAWHHVQAIPVDGGVTIHATDITEKKQREQEIRRQNERL